MKKGFTLVEVLLVIAAIAILAGIVVVAISGCNADTCKPMSEKEECVRYRNYSQKDLPAKCIKYYTNESLQ